MKSLSALNVLLADDDEDDCFFFSKILEGFNIHTNLTVVDNGKKLMEYLRKTVVLPDVLFLDINMPFKNGRECVTAIKADTTLCNLPIIIYSTSLYDHGVDQLYQMGAWYYLRKSSLEELAVKLRHVLGWIQAGTFARPELANFILSNNLTEVV